MIDLSDGLGADAGHVAAASGAGVALELDHVPVAAAAMVEARRLGIAPEQFAAESGEEYELLVVLPETFVADDVLAFRSVSGLALTRVGEVRSGAGVQARLGGRVVALAGYDHFAPRHR
jgi:thiamine-monophosphate kinase